MKVMRVCKECGETKEAVQGTWVFAYGKPRGRVCLRCHSIACKKARSTPAGRAKVNEVALRWARGNRDKVNEAQNKASKKLRATEEGRLKSNAAALKWVRENRDKANALNMRKYAAKLQRTPAWADHAKILEFYTEASRLTRETGTKHGVDHIIPLQGELVSGLHVHTNLQVLTQAANSRKSNKFQVG